MSRIPNEGLKPHEKKIRRYRRRSLNEQNPERGIETKIILTLLCAHNSLNEQNPERGIETVTALTAAQNMWRLNEQNPERGIETAPQKQDMHTFAHV